MAVKIICFAGLLMMVPGIGLAYSSVQTDWSGGGDVYGPVEEWGTDYHSDSGIRSYSDPADISLDRPLLPVPIEHVVEEGFERPYALASADLNGDGHLDLASVSTEEDKIAWWENADGQGTSWTERLIDDSVLDPIHLTCTDVNGDGYADVVACSVYENFIKWWENVDGSGTVWAAHTIEDDFFNVDYVHASDMNGDGHMDVLATTYSGFITSWWENLDGTGLFWEEHEIDWTVQGMTSLCTADINADGFTDVVGGSMSYNAYFWWENIDGTGTAWTRHLVEDYMEFPSFAACGDFDGDGHMDVAGTARDTGMLVWWGNTDGTGTNWSWHTVTNDIVWPTSVFAEDINGDGSCDLLATELATGLNVEWWDNVNGTGTGMVMHTVCADLQTPKFGQVADVNGDRLPDAVAIGYTSDRIAWWNLYSQEYHSLGTLESSVLDKGSEQSWQYLDWSSNEPAGTEVAFQVRASNNPGSMGVWSDTLAQPCGLSGIVADSLRYFQYRVIMATDDPAASPFLHDVAVEWVPVSISSESQSVQGTEQLFLVSPNPASGNAILTFSIPAEASVGIQVYDMSGRVLLEIDDSFAGGVHSIDLGSLPCGTYLARLSVFENRQTLRFVVTE